MPDMRIVVYLIAVASFTVLALPAVALGANPTLPLTYPAQILQGDDNQTCPSEEQQERAKKKLMMQL